MFNVSMREDLEKSMWERSICSSPKTLRKHKIISRLSFKSTTIVKGERDL